MAQSQLSNPRRFHNEVTCLELPRRVRLLGAFFSVCERAHIPRNALKLVQLRNFVLLEFRYGPVLAWAALAYYSRLAFDRHQIVIPSCPPSTPYSTLSAPVQAAVYLLLAWTWSLSREDLIMAQ